MRKYYVYAYLRADRHSPYYVGKGCGWRLIKQEGRRASVPKDRSRIQKIAENLTEQEALELEEKLILFYGRKEVDGGVLLNIQEGGTQPPPKKKGQKGGFPKGKPSWITGRKQKAEWVAKRSKSITIQGVEYYSQAAAARAYGVSKPTITNWRDRGWLECPPKSLVG